MTKRLTETLGIPSLEEVLANIQPEETEEPQVPAVQSDVLISRDELKSTSHGKAMDSLYEEVLGHAKKVADLGFDLDPARAPRMFEVANQLYKTALDAKESKRDAELKLFKLIQEERRLAIEEGKHGVNPADISAKVVVVEDRNVLLARRREERDNK